MSTVQSNILAAKAVPIEQVAMRLGHEVVRHKMRCISRTHTDTDPSLSFNPRTNRFKCFACDLSGDVVDLIQITLGLQLVPAIEWLMGDAVLPSLEPIPARENLRVPRPGNVRLLTAFWRACEPGDWLAHKGLVASQYGVRRVTAQASALIPAFPVGGLFVPYYQHHTITYGRWRSVEGRGARFLGLPDTDTIIYNQDALAGLDGSKPLYLCEGESDTMSLDSLGHVAVGFPGATQYQLLEVLARWYVTLDEKIPQIITAFDDDAAGDRLHQKVLDLELPVTITRFDLKGHNDANDYYRASL